VPLHEGSSREALAVITDLRLPTEAVSTRTPTLDDVYLRLTGTRLQAA
jgi:hypothetical protein